MKIYSGMKHMTGDQLWRKFEDWMKEMWTIYTKKLPQDISSIPSGHQLWDLYKKFALDCYKVEHVSAIQCKIFHFWCAHKHYNFFPFLH
jgi:hypothetical protein